jgi:hypothetical protein
MFALDANWNLPAIAANRESKQPAARVLGCLIGQVDTRCSPDLFDPTRRFAGVGWRICRRVSDAPIGFVRRAPDGVRVE